MNRTLLLMAVAAVATSGVKAQSVTYNHDSPKQNQITVMNGNEAASARANFITRCCTTSTRSRRQARTNCRSARWRV